MIIIKHAATKSDNCYKTCDHELSSRPGNETNNYKQHKDTQLLLCAKAERVLVVVESTIIQADNGDNTVQSLRSHCAGRMFGTQDSLFLFARVNTTDIYQLRLTMT